MNRSAVSAIVVIALVAAAGVFFLTRANEADVVASDTSSTTSTSVAGPTTTSDDPDGTAAPATTTTGPPTADYTPMFEESKCDFDIVTDRPLRCGYLTVPEDRSDPEGSQVQIHVAIFESDDPDAPSDPIVYLDGGPGGETLEPLAFSLEDPWGGFLANRDVVFFDQRGIGASQPALECTETRQLTFDVLDDNLTGAEYLDLEADALAACRSRLAGDGIDLSQYTSATNAADVADLRIALGYDEWNLLGISYGTRLAQTVMRDHPEGIRSVILDSTYPPDADLFSELPQNFDRALDELFTGCDADAACATSYPNLEARMFDLADQLDEAPLSTTVRDVFTNERYDAIINGQTLMDTVFQGLYSAEIIPLLPQLVAELEQGDTSTMTLLMTNDLANGAFLSDGMYLSVQCNEEVAFSSKDDIRAGVAGADPQLERFLVDGLVGFVDQCVIWDVGAADPIENERVSSAIPTLVMAGEYDPITPPRWGEETAGSLTTSTYIEFPGVGHAASVSGDCPLSVALAFFDDPTATIDESCVATMLPPEFAVPGAATPTSIQLAPFEEDIFGITVSGLTPEGWESVGPGAWARQQSFVDQTALVQQAAPGAADPDILIGLFASQLGFEDDPTNSGTVEAGGRTWSLYEGVIDGFPTVVALGPEGGVTGIVVLVASEEEAQTLRTDVLLPVLEAFSAS